MSFSYQDLWEMANGTVSLTNSTRSMTISEAANMFLDEAFFGRKSVEPIQKAMDAIARKLADNPNQMIMGTPEARALNDAVTKVFGAKRCTIYWTANPGFMNGGPCTVMSSALLEGARASYQYGTNANGFYDKNHQMVMAIRMDQLIFTEAHCTSEEAVAVLLHEIGHNFDISTFRLMDAWTEAFTVIINVLLAPNKNTIKDLQNLGTRELISIFGKDVYMALSNLDIYIAQAIPPIGAIMKVIGSIGFNLMKFLNTALSPLEALSIPLKLLMSPFRYMNSMFGRKREIFADSFAASYGYSAELGTGLDKMTKYMSGTDDEGDGFVRVLRDLVALNVEMNAFCTGMHQSVQQRMIRTMSKLDQDLAASGLSAADKASIMAEKERVKEAYEKLLSADAEDRAFLTTKFRKMVDNWYGGKPYMFVPIMGEDMTYAK